MRYSCLVALLALPLSSFAQNDVKDLYQKYEYLIPMRDGTKLYTAVYVPKRAPVGSSPILLERTPYSAGPYGPNAYKSSFRGSQKMKDANYIFAYQDVRGKYMSEGTFENLRPQLQNTYQQSGMTPMPGDIDESTDTYDAVEFLINNVPKNNKRVGLYGISYPGGYAALGAMSRHPALKAVSPQAPTADWFLGDDMHHNGAFFLQDYISFFSGFGVPRATPGPTNPTGIRIDLANDAYKYFLDLGGLANVEEKLYKGAIPYWQDVVRNDTYNSFWQARSVPSGLKNIKAAMLWVGGFFDAEDCWGPLACYKSAEKQANQPNNWIIMGPWYHGNWASPAAGEKFHVHEWGSNTATFFQEEVEFPFFDAFLRGDGKLVMPKATMFDSGAKIWRRFNEWPPKSAKAQTLNFQPNGKLMIGSAPQTGTATYVSDPSNPVPYQDGVLGRRSRTYMLDDQRFAQSRKDVVTFQTEPLQSDLTVAGELKADIYAKVSGTDCDFIVKLIDVNPTGAAPLGDFQMLVRGEVMRAKFRNSFSNPSPLDPNKIEHVPFTLPDTCHTFKKGHRIMIQVQSSWFPLVDRNPHKFMNIFTAHDADFAAASISLQLGGSSASRLNVQTIN
ncbi:MAG: CocE/NonD family hydrolase [Fimbriimonadaceae bacterium]|nr:MAG: CocE/NonD family hydrolase [Fimbriimonadaceae bacterium]